MNYPYPISSPYMHPTMSQAIQALSGGGMIPPGCVLMAVPIQQAQQLLPQLMMNSVMNGADPKIYGSQPSPYYGPSPYAPNPQQHAAPPQNYNYPIVPYKTNNYKSNNKPSKKKPHNPRSNVYNSSSFDSYMDGLSWSRLFDHPSRKATKQPNSDQASSNFDKKSNSAGKQRSESASSSSTTSDETIRRVNVNNPQPPSNINTKQQTKGSLPFKYSSESVPGAGKQQQQQQNSQKIKQNDVFFIKKA